MFEAHNQYYVVSAAYNQRPSRFSGLNTKEGTRMAQPEARAHCQQLYAATVSLAALRALKNVKVLLLLVLFT